jgi:hypothetical protein
MTGIGKNFDIPRKQIVTFLLVDNLNCDVILGLNELSRFDINLTNLPLCHVDAIDSQMNQSIMNMNSFDERNSKKTILEGMVDKKTSLEGVVEKKTSFDKIPYPFIRMEDSMKNLSLKEHAREQLWEIGDSIIQFTDRTGHELEILKLIENFGEVPTIYKEFERDSDEYVPSLEDMECEDEFDSDIFKMVADWDVGTNELTQNELDSKITSEDVLELSKMKLQSETSQILENLDHLIDFNQNLLTSGKPVLKPDGNVFILTEPKEMENLDPYWVAQYPLNDKYLESIDVQLKDWMEAGVVIPIKYDSSRFNLPLWCAPKFSLDGIRELVDRVCIDGRIYNKFVNTGDSFSIPKIDEIYNEIGKNIGFFKKVCTA